MILGMIVLVMFFLFCPLKSESEVQYLRIHIRANSNSVFDQNVKYKVKDELVDKLIPLLSEIDTFEEAKLKISQNFYYIESVVDRVLAENGLNYRSHAKIKNEFFPTRVYENVTLSEGFYDALVVDLGSGEGNNWWCIIFPAFCFTKTQNSDNIEYISLIWEIIKNITMEGK